MSKEVDEKAREYALKQLKYHIDRGDKELTYSTEACINIATKDYTAGYTQAVTDLSTENAQLREALNIYKTALEIIVDGNPISIGLDEVEDLCRNAIDSVEQLLTDNTQENEKD